MKRLTDLSWIDLRKRYEWIVGEVLEVDVDVGDDSRKASQTCFRIRCIEVLDALLELADGASDQCQNVNGSARFVHSSLPRSNSIMPHSSVS